MMEQDEHEIQALIDLMKAEGVKSYLEIGSKTGGSLIRIGMNLPPGSRIVSVDLPHGDKRTQPELEASVNRLRKNGYHVSLILGDSTDPKVVQAVKERGPYDACLIDANHTEPYVRQDFLNYGALCTMVAFHDIGWRREPRPGRLPIEVRKVWDEIKLKYPHKEIMLRGPDQTDNGIGVLWTR